MRSGELKKILKIGVVLLIGEALLKVILKTVAKSMVGPILFAVGMLIVVFVVLLVKDRLQGKSAKEMIESVQVPENLDDMKDNAMEMVGSLVNLGRSYGSGGRASFARERNLPEYIDNESMIGKSYEELVSEYNRRFYRDGKYHNNYLAMPGTIENPTRVGMENCSETLFYDHEHHQWALTDGLGNGYIR